MRHILSCLLLLTFLSGMGQHSVRNQSPHVAADFKKYMYVNFDNPVYITTGSHKTLKISIDNGTITPTKMKGSYLAKPAAVGQATVTLSGEGYKQRFIFEVWPMHYPKIRFIGSPNMDGVINVQTSEGIETSYEPAEVELDFKIDSFTVEVRDSINLWTHLNLGQLWDGETKRMIQQARPHSQIIIQNVYMSREGVRRLKSGAYLRGWIW